MTLIEESADVVPDFEVCDSRANREDFASAIGGGDLGQGERERVLSLRGVVLEWYQRRPIVNKPAVWGNIYLRDDEVSIVQAGCLDLYETVMVTELLQLDIFVQCQGIETAGVLDDPLLRL